MGTTSSGNGRLREHPSKRFADPVRKLDLQEGFEQLLHEEHESTGGHRQITISHEDGLTQTLMHFEQGSGLSDHQVNGIVTVQVFEGCLDVRAAGDTHEVAAGELLTLSRGIRFGWSAREETRMLMTVHLGRHG
jgi:quercetin dioxygenase-like cupin family protein